jgi:hypothetical protein
MKPWVAALNDREAKSLLKKWPRKSQRLWSTPDGGCWLRARPSSGSATAPDLRLVGATKHSTVPDGMWVLLDPSGFADSSVVEVCGSAQNFADKRSRYQASTISLLLRVTRKWLLESTEPTHGFPRWQRSGAFLEAPEEDLLWPIRHLRVLYFLKPHVYETIADSVPIAAHEQIAGYSALKSYNSPVFQEFLRRMDPSKHRYTSG